MRTDQSVAEGNNLCLDGLGSYDPDGDTLSFAWSQVDGPAATLDNANTSGPCFDAPDVGPAGATLHFQLTVTDSYGLSNSNVA